MVESGISGIGVDLLQGNFEVSVESSQNNSWSLGCSVFVEDSNTDVQEFRTKDIALSACFQTEQITVDVNRVESNKELDVDFAINELDVNFGIGGIGGSGGATVESVTKLSDAVEEQKIRVDGLESEISSKAENETVLEIDGKITNVDTKLATQTIRVDGLEASIENTVSKEDFNAATGQLNESYASLKQTTDGLDATIKSNSGEITSIKQNIDGLSVSIKTVSDDLKAIENKIDGVTESYFLPYAPTLENEPAATWIEEGSEESHLGDTFTNTETEGETAGKSWRWLETDGVWGWVPIADTDAQKALLLASQAKEAADGKVTIFYEQPSNYKEGDIWFVHNDNYSPYPEGEILSAIKDNAIFDILDWESKTSYSKTINELDTKMNTTFKDGVLDEAERKVIADGLLSLNQEKASLDYEYNIVVGNANFYDAELKAEYKAAKDAYDEAYNELVQIISNIINAQEGELEGLFDSYKTASESYGEAYANYVSSKEQVSEALSGRLNPANIYIGHIASDGYLTPIEKEQMFEIYRSLAKEYNTAKGNAYNYKIWQYAEDGKTEEAGMNGTNGRYDTYVEYKESFVPIVSVFTSSTWGFDKMSETTELPEGSSTLTIKEYLDTYYECLGALSEIFSAITISIQEAQKRGEETLAELTNILAPEEMDTKIGKGVVLSTIIATKDTQGNITAGMNASNEFSDATHKRVVIAGGVNDKTDWNDSEFRLYEDGHFVAKSGELGENVKIGNALITSVLYGDINLLSYPENGKLIPLFTIEKDANGKISSVSSAYDFKVNGDLLVYGESATGGEGQNTTPSINLDNLDDVTLGGLRIGDLLLFNGSQWVNAPQSEIVPNVDLTGYATENYVDSSIANLINGAPTTLDTLKEIADAFEQSQDVVEALDLAIGNKADKATTLAGYGITNAYTKEQTYDRTHIDSEFEDYETALATKALKSEVYTKEQIDGKLTGITTDIDNLEDSKADNTTVNAIDDRLKAEEDVTKTYSAWWKDLMTYVKVVDENVVIDTNLLVEGESATRGTGDPSTGGGIDKNQLADYLEEYKYINEDALLEYGYATEQDVNEAIDALNIGQYAKTSEVERLFTALNIGQYAKTADVNTALGGKVDKVDGKGLSTNDFTTALLNKLNAIAEGAEVNVQSDWNATSGDAFIKNKPTFADVATSGSYNDLSGTPDLSVYALTDDVERLFTALNISQYAKTSELGDLAFVDSLSKSDVGLGNVANETYAGGTAVTLNGFSKAKTTASFYAPTSAGTVGYFLKSQGAGDAPIWSALGALATKDSLTYSDVGVTKAVITSLIGTTTYAAYNANGYLPLNGGEISGNMKIVGMTTISRAATFPLIVENSLSDTTSVAIRFRKNSQHIGAIGFTPLGEPILYNGDLSQMNTLIHSGNIGSQFVEGIGTPYANQDINLGKEGKVRMIYGTASNSTTLGYPRQYVSGLSVLTGYSGWQMVTYGGSTILNPYFRSMFDDGTFSDWKTIAFTDSDFKLGLGHSITDSNDRSALSISADNQINIGYGTAGANFNTNIHGASIILKYGTSRSWGMVMNTSGNVTIGDSDKASTSTTTKLYVDGGIRFAPRTIWGQSFDGTGNVSGHFTLGKAVIYNGNSENVFDATAGVAIGYGIRSKGSTSYWGSNHDFRVGDSRVMLINSSGNVTIGDNDLASTITKLYVDGDITLSNNKTLYFRDNASKQREIIILNSLNQLAIGRGNALQQSDTYIFGNNIYLKYGKNEGVAIGISYNGNVLVEKNLSVLGTTTLSSTLSVGGQTTINNNLIVYGESASTSDMRFKDVVENKSLRIADIAKAPCFSFTWKEKDDKSLHLGTSAQYWEAIAPELVTGEDFKALNYASLGVAMGIALAKESINHEDRIKNLEDEIKILNGELKRLRYGIHQ